MTPQPTLTLTGTGNLQIHIPMRIRRMRGRKMIFAPQALDGEVPDGPADVQAAVVQALGRAFSWAEAIESGEVHSISDLARTLDVDNSYVVRILKLTTLAPDIIEAILHGEEPSGLSLAQLIRTFPMDWERQRAPVRVHPGLSPTPPSRAVRGRGPILEQDVRHTAGTPHWTRQLHDVGPTRRPSAEVAAPPPPARVRTSQSRGRPSLFSRPLNCGELYTRLHDADKASKGVTTL